MKFIKKIPKVDKSLSEELINDGWRGLNEPSSLKESFFTSIPIMILVAVVYLSIIAYINPSLYVFFDIKQKLFSTLRHIDLKFLILSYILAWVHEFIHLICIPNALKSDKVYIGVTPLYGFVCIAEEVTKSRLLICLIMPFLILSVVAPIVLNMFGLLSINLCLIGLFNAIGSSVDILSAILIVTQVPNKSMLINNGVFTYFK